MFNLKVSALQVQVCRPQKTNQLTLIHNLGLEKAQYFFMNIPYVQNEISLEAEVFQTINSKNKTKLADDKYTITLDRMGQLTVKIFKRIQKGKQYSFKIQLTGVQGLSDITVSNAAVQYYGNSINTPTFTLRRP